MNRRHALLVLVVLCAESSLAQAGKQVTYYITDPLGTPLAQTDASGNVISTADYRPYGAQALGISMPGLGYAGQIADDAAVVYMQQRYYDASIGRFLSVDPLRPSDVDASRFMRYGYANENPYRFVDPDGRGTVAIGVTGSVTALAGITGTRQVTISMVGWHISTLNIGYYTAGGGVASTVVGPSAAFAFSYSSANSAEEMADTSGLASAGGGVNLFGGSVSVERSLCDRCNPIWTATVGGKIPQLPFEAHTSVTESVGSTLFSVSDVLHPTVTVGDITPPPPPPPPPPQPQTPSDQ
jgi:RHS repeat-associated protein